MDSLIFTEITPSTEINILPKVLDWLIGDILPTVNQIFSRKINPMTVE